MYARRGYIYNIILVMRVVHVQNHANVGNLNSHFWDLNWRYLPYVYKASISGLCKGIPTHKKRPDMVQYLHFRVLKFPRKSLGFKDPLLVSSRDKYRCLVEPNEWPSAHISVWLRLSTRHPNLLNHTSWGITWCQKKVTPGTVRRSILLSSN